MSLELYQYIVANLPKAVQEVAYYNGPTYSHEACGWYARDDVKPDMCRPWYTAPGGGISASSVGGLEDALDQTIIYAKRNRDKAQRHLDRLIAARDALRPTPPTNQQ